MPIADIYKETKHLTNPIVIEAPALSASDKYDNDIDLLLQTITVYKSYPPFKYTENPSFDFFQEEDTNTLIEYNDINAQSYPEYYNKNLKKLNSSFNKELSSYTHYLQISNLEAKEIFNKTASVISHLPFENSAVELTRSNSIKFTLSFPGNKLLMISKPVSSIQNLNEEEVIFSLFINRELIASNAVELANFKEGFDKYLSM